MFLMTQNIKMWPVTAACGVLCNVIAGDQGGGQGGDQAVTAHSTSHINQHKPGPAPAKINRSDSVWCGLCFTASLQPHCVILPQMGEVFGIISQHLSALKIKTTIKLRLAYQWYQLCTSWRLITEIVCGSCSIWTRTQCHYQEKCTKIYLDIIIKLSMFRCLDTHRIFLCNTCSFSPRRFCLVATSGTWQNLENNRHILRAQCGRGRMDQKHLCHHHTATISHGLSGVQAPAPAAQ